MGLVFSTIIIFYGIIFLLGMDLVVGLKWNLEVIN